MKARVTVGLVEKITLKGNGKSKTLLAKTDTGATKSSIDVKLSKQLKLGPIIKSKVVKTAHGSQLRPIVEAEVIISKKKMKAEFTVADRSHLKYPVLIGQNILKKGFIIDPLKRNNHKK